MKIHCKNVPIKNMEQKVFVEMQIGELVALVCGYGGNCVHGVSEQIDKYAQKKFAEELKSFNGGSNTYRPMHNALVDLGVFERYK